MFLVVTNKDNLPQDVILVTTNIDKAIAQFLDTCSTETSNWDDYDQEDKDALVEEGYCEIGDKTVVMVDTSGFCSDEAIRDELTHQPAGDMTVAEIIEDGEVELKLGMTVDQILELCGNNLDACESHDIQGQILFKGSDGKWYTITTESTIGIAHPGWVEDTLAENKNEG